jgi:dipeptidyl aminopeptidase/acylaminoacyl peptidase
VEAAQGYLVFPREQTLMAQAFDAGSGRTTGEAVTIGEHIALGPSSGDFSVSRNGVLVYRSQEAGLDARVVWLDRAGHVLGEAAPPGAYSDLALSPDGHSIVLGIVDPQKSSADLWVRDLARGVMSRLTFDDAEHINPVWSPDGQRVMYAANRHGPYQPYIQQASGVGAIDSLAAPPRVNLGATDWSRDGHTVAYRAFADARWDVWLGPAEGGKPPTPFLNSPSSETFARFSPDGRWLAYQTDESGRNEIYVRPVSGAQGKWQISINGGSSPEWRGDGKEIFFLGADQSIMAAPIESAETFRPGTPKALFRASLIEGRLGGFRWVVTPDGNKFLALTANATQAVPRFTVVTNWTNELKQK